MKLKCIVIFDLEDEEIDEYSEKEIINELEGELVKVKTGEFENRFVGVIKEVEIIKEEE